MHERYVQLEMMDIAGDLGGRTGAKVNRPELKRYRQYTRHDIAAAIDAVRSGMSALQASRLYGVPSRTLYDKVNATIIFSDQLSIWCGGYYNPVWKRLEEDWIQVQSEKIQKKKMPHFTLKHLHVISLAGIQTVDMAPL